ncbi:MAG TPA: hypothetical protein VM888_03665 [Chitinophagaceae bacterium]|nr:hypothetical protein [Chitinophagaceae bacterium]
MRYLLLLLIPFFFSSFVQGQDIPLTVISNAKGAPSEINFGTLKSILRGERQRWPDGTKVVIALMKTNTATGSTTSKKIYNMSGDELNKFWLALVFQGKSDAPTFFNSTADLESFVARTPGAIGVTTAGSVVRHIVVEGKISL